MSNLARGRFGEAALLCAAAVPFAGNAALAVRGVRRADDVLDATRAACRSNSFVPGTAVLGAAELVPGDALRGPHGTAVSVVAVARHRATATVHNLTVDGAHTYYAGEPPVLVHNCHLAGRAADDVADGSSIWHRRPAGTTFSMATPPVVVISGLVDPASHRFLKHGQATGSCTRSPTSRPTPRRGELRLRRGAGPS